MYEVLKMKKIINQSVITILISLLFVSSAYAGAWTGKFEMPELRFYNSYILVRNVNETIDSASACSRTDYFRLDKTHERFDQVYATLLAARVSNSEVNFYITGCDGASPNDRQRILYVIIY